MKEGVDVGVWKQSTKHREGGSAKETALEHHKVILSHANGM